MKRLASGIVNRKEDMETWIISALLVMIGIQSVTTILGCQDGLPHLFARLA